MHFRSNHSSHRAHRAMTQSSPRTDSRSSASLRGLRVRVLCPLWLIGLSAVPSAQAGLVFTQTFLVGKNIADLGELADVRTVSFSGGVIDDVTVGLRIDSISTLNPAASGDYYAGLGHGSGYAVLLNRVGKTSTAAWDTGSGHGGIDVTLNDAAPNGDIHLAPFDANSDAPPALTGAWAPDGRTADPGLASSPRTATLSSFNGLAPGGAWELLLADDSAGGAGRLVSWSLSLNITPSGDAPLSIGGSGGTLTFDAPQILANDLVNQGRLVAPSGPGGTITLSGNVSGAGSYSGDFVFSGSFSPGNSPAAVTFDGDLTFAPSHVLTMEIGGTTPGTEYDTISVGGTFDLGSSTLNVVFINGFVPQPSDFFQFFNATSIGGSFAQVNLPAGYNAVGNLAGGDGFTLTAVPEPATWAALGGLAVLAATLRRRGYSRL